MPDLMSNASLVKAYLEIKENPGPSGPRLGGSPGGASTLVDGLGVLTFRFNPKQYSISKSAKWASTPRPAGGRNAPEAQHVGPEPRTLSLEIFFDESDSPTGDVSGDVDALLNCCNPRKRTNHPPIVVFGWGSHVSFDAYVSSVSVRYTMFRQDGTPFRATATVTLNEHAEHMESQNPTSGTRALHGAHTTVAGDTLASIAYHEYGKASYWRAIAEINGIDVPLRLRPGVSLLLPPAAEAARVR